MNSITAKELFEIKDGDLIILDIRSPAQYKSGHIKNSLNINVYGYMWQKRFDESRERLKILPKGKTIIAVCNSGTTTKMTCPLLESMGYKALNLEGGMAEWANSGYPVEF